MGMWLKVKEFLAPSQYKEGAAMLELSEKHTDSRMEFWDDRLHVIAELHEITTTVQEKH